MKPITLKRGEYIAAVVPEYASGPGWANRPMWVFICDNGSNQFRQECIQPEEQTVEMRALFSPGAAMCAALKGSVLTKRDKGESK